jgi:hypothetical protein
MNPIVISTRQGVTMVNQYNFPAGGGLPTDGLLQETGSPDFLLLETGGTDYMLQE